MATKDENDYEDEVDEMEDEDEDQEQSGGTGHSIAKAAAIAAASGATAYAARKALESRSSGGGSSSNGSTKEDRRSNGGGKGTTALLGTAVTSGWEVAKDSLLPVIEEAATKAGTFVAERSPEVVRDVVVPRFIAGFEGATGGRSRGRKQPQDK